MAVAELVKCLCAYIAALISLHKCLLKELKIKIFCQLQFTMTLVSCSNAVLTGKMVKLLE